MKPGIAATIGLSAGAGDGYRTLPRYGQKAPGKSKDSKRKRKRKSQRLARRKNR